MDEMQLGTVIAQCEFDCGAEKVVLEIGTPYPVDEGKTWFCPYRIAGLGQGKVKRAGGIDSVQALYGALQIAAVDLYTSEEALQKRLKWVGQNNLGLPVLAAITDLVPPENE